MPYLKEGIVLDNHKFVVHSCFYYSVAQNGYVHVFKNGKVHSIRWDTADKW
jgi:hypothetical protein